MILPALLLAAGLAADSSAASMPVRLHNRSVPRGPRGRLSAVPMGAGASFDSLIDRFYTWVCPDSGDNIRILLTRFGSRADLNSGMIRLQISSRTDPEGLRYHANPDSFESVEPDTTHMCEDLNGDGHPDVVVKHHLRELPLTGEWIDVIGSHAGKMRLWCTRKSGWIPKSLVDFPNEARPLVWVVEPHSHAWPYLRTDPPGRDRLISLQDSLAVDVSAKHPEWYAASLTVSGQVASTRTATRNFDVSWATSLLQHTWILLTAGRKEEAKAFFENRFSRAGAMDPPLQNYLLEVRKELVREWSN